MAISQDVDTLKIRTVLLSGGAGTDSLTEALLKQSQVSLTILINVHDDRHSTRRLWRFVPAFGRGRHEDRHIGRPEAHGQAAFIGPLLDTILRVNATDSAGWTLTPGRNPEQGFGPWFARAFLSCWTFLLYGFWLSDTLTGDKLYPSAFFRNLVIETKGFETDHEITAKLIRAGYRIREAPVSYRPRSKEEGKKIRAGDGLIAVWTLLRFRFAGFASGGQAGPA